MPRPSYIFNQNFLPTFSNSQVHNSWGVQTGLLMAASTTEKQAPPIPTTTAPEEQTIRSPPSRHFAPRRQRPPLRSPVLLVPRRRSPPVSSCQRSREWASPRRNWKRNTNLPLRDTRSRQFEWAFRVPGHRFPTWHAVRGPRWHRTGRRRQICFDRIGARLRVLAQRLFVWCLCG